MKKTFKPHDYQAVAIDEVLTKEKCGLFLDMGLGKTIITLTAIEQLMYQDFDVSKVLIVAPKKVAESTWDAECEKWEHTSKFKIAKVLGTQKERLDALATDSDIYLMNRENIPWLVSVYNSKKFPFDMVVLDESSSFKNYRSQRFKALKSVLHDIERVVLLTGTPAPNGLMDLWAQIFLLDGGERLGRNITTYRINYFKPGQTNGHIVYNYRPQEGANDLILSRIDDICISMKAKDYLDLPETIFNPVTVCMDKKTRDTYEEFEREQILTLAAESEFTDDGDVVIPVLSAAGLRNKLTQFANGAVYYDDEYVDEFTQEVKSIRKYKVVHDEKIKALLNIVEEANGQPILLAYNFQSDKERILKALAAYDVRELKTDKDVRDWNKGEISVMLTHPASSAYGLNLQDGGHICVWFGVTWDLQLYLQFNKRLDRQGQKYPVIIHHILTAGTDDAKMVRSLQAKDDVQETFMRGLKAKIKKYKKDLR